MCVDVPADVWRDLSRGVEGRDPAGASEGVVRLPAISLLYSMHELVVARMFNEVKRKFPKAFELIRC